MLSITSFESPNVILSFWGSLFQIEHQCFSYKFTTTGSQSSNRVIKHSAKENNGGLYFQNVGLLFGFTGSVSCSESYQRVLVETQKLREAVKAARDPRQILQAFPGWHERDQYLQQGSMVQTHDSQPPDCSTCLPILLSNGAKLW